MESLSASLPSAAPSVSSKMEDTVITSHSALATGLALIAAERDGIGHLHDVYSTDPIAQKGFEAAVETLVRTRRAHGHVVVSGVGKSGLIGKKMTATLNSLGIRSNWMHPTEALHGDLGMIGPHDALVLLTFSGSTAELLSLVCHLPAASPLILMSSARPDEGCPISSMPLFAARIDSPPECSILLPTPVPVAEKTLFGVAAPTVSTTVTLALGDALAMAAANRLHQTTDGVRETFRLYHPGGAIGRANVKESQMAALGRSPSSGESDASTSSLEGSTVGDDMYVSPAPLPEPVAISPVGETMQADECFIQSAKAIELDAERNVDAPVLESGVTVLA